MRLVAWKRILLCPALFLQVGNDMLAGHRIRCFAKPADSLLNARFMVAHPPMPHSILRRALKLIQPHMHFFVGSAEMIRTH